VKQNDVGRTLNIQTRTEMPSIQAQDLVLALTKFTDNLLDTSRSTIHHTIRDTLLLEDGDKLIESLIIVAE
jgi:hypothetical protein